MHDDDLERELRQAAEVLDPVPAHLLPRAVAAFAWRTIDADLAELAFDSLAEPAAPVRGPGQPRLLTFRTDEQIIELELDTEGTDRRLVGRITPATAADVEIRHERGTTRVTADHLGRFAAGGLAPGPMRLRCDPAAPGAAIVTDWFSG